MTSSLRSLALGLFSLTVLDAGGAGASIVRPETFKCPIGGEEFQSLVVRSGYQQGQRLDLRPYGMIVSPIPLPQCSGNGFVMYKDEFSDEELEKLKPIVASKDYQAIRKIHRTYYLAAFLEEKMGTSDSTLAAYYLRASWQVEGGWGPRRTLEKLTRQERNLLVRYRTLALEKLDRALAHETRGSEDWWRSAILAAELERLLGRFAGAQKRLSELPAAEASEGQRSAMTKIRNLAAAGNAQPAAQGSD